MSTCGLLRGKEESGVQPWDAVARTGTKTLPGDGITDARKLSL